MPNRAKEERHSIPGEFENLGELAVPPPIQADDRRQHQGEPRLEQSTAQKTRWGNIYSDYEEKYNPPDEYENLDELKAPSLVESPHVERPQGYLEDRQSSTTHSVKRRDRDLPRGGAAPPEQSLSSSPTNLSHVEKHPHTRNTQVSRFATQLYTISHLIFFSILGTLARLGLQALTSYPGAPIQTGLLWANVGGSLILGFLIEDGKLFHNHASFPAAPPAAPLTQQEPGDEEQQQQQQQNLPPPSSNHKKTIPLYIGLATGFCGSFTSFSSFIRDAFLALANALPVPISHTSASPIDPASTVHRNGGYSFMALLAVVITTISLSISALVVGAQLALAVERYTPSIPQLMMRKLVDRSIVFLAWGFWLGAVLMAIWPPDRSAFHPEYWRGRAIFAIVFAPLGCLARFYMSLLLNSKIAAFPLGTFTINLAGTLLQGMLWDLQHSPSTVGGGIVGCQVFQGMMDGFCGAATTVSTWVAELRGLRRRHAWVYGASSVLVALGGLVGVMGGVLWGKGWERPVCL